MPLCRKLTCNDDDVFVVACRCLCDCGAELLDHVRSAEPGRLYQFCISVPCASAKYRVCRAAVTRDVPCQCKVMLALLHCAHRVHDFLDTHDGCEIPESVQCVPFEAPCAFACSARTGSASRCIVSVFCPCAIAHYAPCIILAITSGAILQGVRHCHAEFDGRG
jgi:hypothetical protein